MLKFSDYKYPLSIIFISSAFTILIGQWIESRTKTDLNATTKIVTENLASNVSLWINSRLKIINHLAEDINSDYTDNPEDFELLVQPIMNFTSGFQAINWIDKNGTISVVVPLESNPGVKGINLEVHPREDVRDAFEQAKGDNSICRTLAGIQLLQGGIGMTTYRSVRNRNGDLLGFVNGVFKIDTLEEEVFSHLDFQDHFIFRLNEEDGFLLFQSDTPAPAENNGLENSFPFLVADKNWVLTVYPTENMISGWLGTSLTIFKVSGAVFALLLASVSTLLIYKKHLLEKSESSLRTIFEQASVGVALVESKTGRFIRINKLYCDMVGYTEKDLLGGMTFSDITHPEDIGSDLNNIPKLISGEITNFNLEKRYLRKDGGTIWVSLTVSPTWKPGEEPVHHISVVIDITERILANEALLQYQKIVTSSTDMLAMLDSNQQYLLVNDAYANAFGKIPSEIIGSTPANVFGQQIYESVIQSDLVRCLNGEALTKQKWVKFPEIGNCYMDVSFIPNLDDNKNVIGVIIGARNITQRKRAEQKLKISEEKNRAWLDSSPVCTKIIDLDFNLQYMSSAGVEGLHLGDISHYYGKRYPLDIFFDSFRSQMTKNLELVKETGKIITQEAPVCNVDGDTLWFHSTLLPVNDDDGKIDHIMIVSVDVTERTKAEEALSSSENKFRSLVDSSPVCIHEIDLDGNLMSMNQTGLTMLGVHNESEIYGLSFLEIPVPEDRDRVSALMDRAINGESCIFEFSSEGEDGRVYFQSSFSPIMNENGSVIKLMGITQDITLSKQAEKSLRDSEEKYRNILTSIEEAYYEVDLTGSLTFFNDSICRILGKSRNELMGMDFRLYMDKKNATSVKQAFIEVYNTGIPKKSSEWELMRDDGTQCSIQGSISLLLDNDKQPIGFRGILLDITKRKKAEAEKEEHYARSTGIIKNSVNSVFTIDEQGIIESLNPSAITLFGYAESELIGQNISIIMPEPDRGNHDGYLKAYRDTGVKNIIDSPREVEGIKKDGTVFPLRISVSEVKFGGKRIFAGIIQDLTHEFELEQQLLQAHKMESLGTLAGGIAHDFNNILQAIMGFTKIAQDNINSNPEILAQCLEETAKGSQRASNLVNQILTFSRKTNVKTKPLKLQSLINEALKFIRNTFPSSIQINFDIDEECSPIMANPTQIHQIITNLCTNALHSMEKKGGILTVSLQSFVTTSSMETLTGQLDAGEYIQLSISDTGTGIEPTIIHRITDPFFTTKDPGKGTGLGLAMIHGICASMNGGLRIESILNEGTTVNMYFPHSEIGVELENPQELLTENKEGDGGHVLLVDDEVAITTLIGILFESSEFTVDSFNDVHSALKAVEENPVAYDFAILDYTMPSMTGIELAQKMYTLNPNIRIVLATGLIGELEINESIPPNVVEVIKKPFDIDIIIQIFNKISLSDKSSS